MVAYNVITLTGGLALNETHPAVFLPAGARVHGVRMTTTDLDNGTALVLALGDAVDVDRLMTGLTIGQAGGTSTVMAATAAFTYTAPTAINITATTGAGTGVSGTVEVEVAYYVVP
jgi:hypothetical protein